MPVTALIADDEEAPREQLAVALRKAWPELDVVAQCTQGVDAWDAYLEHDPQVCFLDIRMPGMSGIEVAQRIGGRAIVVFVSAFGDHALAAFDAGAVDYVLKPLDAERLAQAVQRVQQRLAQPPEAVTPLGLQQLLAKLMPQVQRAPPLSVIQASVGKEVRLVRVEDIVYFEADTRYTRVVYQRDGKDGDVLIRTPLKELLAQLDSEHFWQVHRSVIVARRHVASAVKVDDNNMHLNLLGRPERLPVSRHFQALFKGQ